MAESYQFVSQLVCAFASPCYVAAMEQALAEQTVVIIGGTGGLGRSAALACRQAGANVVAVGRDSDHVTETDRALGAGGRAITGDATDPDTAVQAIECAKTTFGGCQGLYHVAGGSGRRFGDGPLHAVTDEGIDATLRLNLNSLIYANRAAVQHFREQGQGGVVLNMGSVLGFSPAPKWFATHIYAATKSAVVGFTKSCASYYAAEDIRFNVIAPALFETPMAQRAANDQQIQQYIHTKQPLDGGRIGQPQDADGTAVFLLSEASRFITGQVISVDGGWCVSEGQLNPDEA
jgi:NAD(P)-dependent dehydrogenase (short-subunit alcohol dehydrogenase family)